MLGFRLEHAPNASANGLNQTHDAIGAKSANNETADNQEQASSEHRLFLSRPLHAVARKILQNADQTGKCAKSGTGTYFAYDTNVIAPAKYPKSLVKNLHSSQPPSRGTTKALHRDPQAICGPRSRERPPPTGPRQRA
jgi:hypothetical protein